MLPRVGLATLLGLVACDSGSGCTDVPYPDPPPVGGEIQAGVARVRVTAHLLEFVRTHLPDLLGTFFTIEDGRAVFYLDETLFDSTTDPLFIRDACIGEPDEPCAAAAPPAEQGPTYPSTIALDTAHLAEALELTWLAPDGDARPGIHFAVRDFELFVDLALVVNLPDSTGVAACHIEDGPGGAALEVAELSFDLRLDVVDGDPPAFASTVQNVVIDLGDADDSTLNLAVSPCDGSSGPSCDDPRCAGAWGDFEAPDCPGVCGLLDLFSELGGFLAQVLTPLLDELGPALANTVSEALISILAGVPLGLQTDIDLGGDSLTDAEPLHVGLAASTDLGLAGTGAGRGLDLAFDVGVTSAARAACVPDTAPPGLNHGPPPKYSGFIEVTDADGSHLEPYHLAAGLSEATIRQGAWAAHQSGLLCIDLDAYDVEALTDHAFTLTAGLLMSFDSRLAGLSEPGAPLALSLRAPEAPGVRLGAGGPITPELDDPLIELSLNDVEVDIFVFIDGQFLRLSRVVTDVMVSLGVERTPARTLELVLDGITISDQRQVYNELAPAADLSNLLALMIDLAVGQLLGDSSSFALDFTGNLSDLGMPLSLRLNDLRRDLGPTGTPYLSLFATLCDDADIANPDRPWCYQSKSGRRSATGPVVKAEPLYVEPGDDRFPSERWARVASGRALLVVDARHEYQTRVDGGAWSTFRTPVPVAGAITGHLEVASPRLHVVGFHRIEVRSRLPGAYRERTTPTAVGILVDGERPAVDLVRHGDTVHVTLEELGTPDAVELFARIDGGPWSPAGFAIDVRNRIGTLEVVAKDLAGNRSKTASLPLGGAPADDDGTSETGCAATPGPPVAMLLALWAMWRRRR